MNLEFSRHFSRRPRISNFIKIHPLGAELFHADVQTGRRDEGNSIRKKSEGGQVREMSLST